MVCFKVVGLVGIFVGLTRVVELDKVVCTTDVVGSIGLEVDGLVSSIDIVVGTSVIDSDD